MNREDIKKAEKKFSFILFLLLVKFKNLRRKMTIYCYTATNVLLWAVERVETTTEVTP